MNQKLRSMVAFIGIFLVGGVSYSLFQGSPAGRTIAELRDAGVDNDAVEYFSLVCPEKISKKTAAKLNNLGMCVGCKVGQIKRIARVAFLHGDAGEVVVPSMSVSALDGGDTEGDDSVAVRSDDCYRLDAGILHPIGLDGGWVYPRVATPELESPFENGPGRLALVVPPCVLPNCFTLPDGGWNDDAVVDCDAVGTLGLADGGRRWRGCNVTPTVNAVGMACLPVECTVVAGDNPIEVLQ